MFCSAKKSKDTMETIYKFYLCERNRVSGKIKCNDKYIITLDSCNIIDLRVTTASLMIKNKVKNKGYDIETCNAVELVFNKYLSIREGLIEKKKAKEDAYNKGQEEYARARDNEQREFNEKVNNKKYGSYEGKYKGLFNVDIVGGCIYTEKEKEYLKVIYKSAIMKLHPDATGGDSEGFLFLTKLKEQWGI